MISNLEYKIWAHRPWIKGTIALFIVIKAIIIIWWRMHQRRSFTTLDIENLFIFSFLPLPPSPRTGPQPHSPLHCVRAVFFQTRFNCNWPKGCGRWYSNPRLRRERCLNPTPWINSTTSEWSMARPRSLPQTSAPPRSTIFPRFFFTIVHIPFLLCRSCQHIPGTVTISQYWFNKTNNTHTGVTSAILNNCCVSL